MGPWRGPYESAAARTRAPRNRFGNAAARSRSAEARL